MDVWAYHAGDTASFYEGFVLRETRGDHIQHRSLSCTFKVPPRLTDMGGNLSADAIVDLVDEVGGAAIQADGHHMMVLVDISESFFTSISFPSVGSSSEVLISICLLLVWWKPTGGSSFSLLPLRWRPTRGPPPSSHPRPMEARMSSASSIVVGSIYSLYGLQLALLVGALFGIAPGLLYAGREGFCIFFF